MAWISAPLNSDLITVEELDHLNDSELRQFYDLLVKARNGNSVEVEARVIATNGHAAAPAITEPVEPPAQPPAPIAAPVQPAPTEPKPAPVEYDWRQVEAANEERRAALKRAEELVALLRNADPLTKIGDPLRRAALIRELNDLAMRFNRPLWREPNERDWNP